MILLSFDCEQWNCPLLEGHKVPENDSLEVTNAGNKALLELLARKKVRGTFFITGFYAEKEPSQVRKIAKEGHEIACHGYNHFYRGNEELDLAEDIKRAKKVLEETIGKKVSGFRSPQMQYSKKLLRILDKLGFNYDSSLHPAYLPGFYNFSQEKKEIFRPLENRKIIEVPVAVSRLRLPVNWLFTRLFGAKRTIRVCRSLISEGITPVLYFHTWEFTRMQSKYVPFYYNYRTGQGMLGDLEKIIDAFGRESFMTIEKIIKYNY